MQPWRNFPQTLIQLAKEQPSHPLELQVIQEAVSAAIKEWQADPDLVNNSLIILSSPVSAVTRILTDSMAHWVEQHDWSINLLDWIERPLSAEQLQPNMSATLRQSGTDAQNKNVVVIPNLSWCFLRSAEGLDGIDYLRDSLLSDHSQFWVIGSGQVGWQYLNSVLKLKAHCGEVVILPNLSGKQLQNWLMPIIQQLEIQFDQTSIQERLQEMGEEQSDSFSFRTIAAVWEEMSATARSLFRGVQEEVRSLDSTANEKDNNSEWTDYFERLSDLSDGVSTIALQLFIKSIGYEKIENDAEQELLDQVSSEETEALLDGEPPPPHRLVARLPRLPELPDLEQGDRYILYSLLVHGDLRLDALAESLGEARQIVNDQVQLLRKTGLIEQKGRVMKVNPVHYPRLKRELVSNNFAVKLED